MVDCCSVDTAIKMALPSVKAIRVKMSRPRRRKVFWREMISGRDKFIHLSVTVTKIRLIKLSALPPLIESLSKASRTEVRDAITIGSKAASSGTKMPKVIWRITAKLGSW